MRKILISTRGEFEVKRNDYAMALAIKMVAQLVRPNKQEESEEKVELVYSIATHENNG